jgi:hypothetical protein
MPDEEQRQPSQQPTEGERAPVRRDFSKGEDAARDGETLRATGTRPSPNPNPDPGAPEGPVNKAVEFADSTHHEVAIVGDTLSETRTETAPPPPPPATDSGEEKA